MMRTGTDPQILIRNTAVNQAVEAVWMAKLAYKLNPGELTRYQLVVAQERLVTVCRVLGIV